MSLVSDDLIRRAKAYVGRELTSAEVDDFRRMSELLGQKESDLAWAIILAMWAARLETTTALTDAREDVRAGLEIWMERVGKDLETIDERRRSLTREIAAEAQNSAAAIHRAAGQSTAILSSRLDGLDSKVAEMTASVERAMKGATGALAAAQKRDVEIQKQVEALAGRYAHELSNKLEFRADAALKRAEVRLQHAAEQAQIAARPLLVSYGLIIFGIVLGTVTTTALFKWVILP